jgi:hypothetical protein
MPESDRMLEWEAPRPTGGEVIEVAEAAEAAEAAEDPTTSCFNDERVRSAASGSVLVTDTNAGVPIVSMYRSSRFGLGSVSVLVWL